MWLNKVPRNSTSTPIPLSLIKTKRKGDHGKVAMIAFSKQIDPLSAQSSKDRQLRRRKLSGSQLGHS